jgi:hypothetical protein
MDVGKLGSPARLLDLAEEKFGVRSLELGYWAKSLIDRPWLAPDSELRQEILTLAGE